MIRILTIERRVLTWSLHTVPNVHDLFTRHQLEWMARSVGHYSEDLVREFYATYVATLAASLDRQSNPTKQTPLTYVRVLGCRLDISFPTICCFLYCTDTDANRVPLTPRV